MGKRNKLVIESPASKALMKLRNNAELSLRKLADRMDISFTRVHQLETGREEVGNEYITNFLRATGYSWDDWEDELNIKPVVKSRVSQARAIPDTPKLNQCAGGEKTRIECLRIITKLSNQKLEVALELLTNIA